MRTPKREQMQGSSMSGFHLSKKKSIISITSKLARFLINSGQKSKVIQVLEVQTKEKTCLHLFPSITLSLKLTHMFSLTFHTKKSLQQQSQQPLTHLKLSLRAIFLLLNLKDPMLSIPTWLLIWNKGQLFIQAFLSKEWLSPIKWGFLNPTTLQQESQQEIQELDSVIRAVTPQWRQAMWTLLAEAQFQEVTTKGKWSEHPKWSGHLMWFQPSQQLLNQHT